MENYFNITLQHLQQWSQDPRAWLIVVVTLVIIIKLHELTIIHDHSGHPTGIPRAKGVGSMYVLLFIAFLMPTGLFWYAWYRRKKKSTGADTVK